MASDLLLLIVGLLVTFDAVAIFTLIFFERRDPESVLAWLFAVVTLPLVGFVLYLIFGFKYFKTRAFGLKSTGDRALLGRIQKGLEPGLPDGTGANIGRLDAYQDLARLLWADSAAFLTEGNQLDVFTTGPQKFDALFAAIASAKSHIHLEDYILRDDALGRRLLRALEGKAREGVEVRLLYDDLGNKIPRLHYRALTEAGGRVSGFYRALVPSVGFRLNYRNHRKIAVIDGTVGFIGGFNIGEEYPRARTPRPVAGHRGPDPGRGGAGVAAPVPPRLELCDQGGPDPREHVLRPVPPGGDRRSPDRQRGTRHDLEPPAGRST